VWIRLRRRQERPSDANLLFRRGRDGAVFSLFGVRNPTEPQAAQTAWLSVFARAYFQFDEAMSLVMTDRMKKNQSDTMPAMMRLFFRERLDFFFRERLDFCRSILVRSARFSTRSWWFEASSSAIFVWTDSCSLQWIAFPTASADASSFAADISWRFGEQIVFDSHP
jgi:hypothetical protein